MSIDAPSQPKGDVSHMSAYYSKHTPKINVLPREYSSYRGGVGVAGVGGLYS